MKEILTSFVAVIVGIALIAVVVALPVMLLWNILMPEIFGIKEVSFWQALGLNLLCGFLWSTGAKRKD